MIPDNELSTTAVVGGYPDPVKQPGDLLVDWERGGLALNDASQGLLYQLWKLEVVRDEAAVDLWHFVISAPTVPRTTLFSHEDVTEASLSFDLNMNPFVAFVAGQGAFIYWYDPVAAAQTITSLALGVRSPRCTIDEKREFNSGHADNVLGYIRDGQLMVLYQRDRYTVEYPLCETGSEAELVSMATSSNGRLQWRIRNTSINESDSRYKVTVDPLLADVVQDLYERSSVPRDYLEVNDLYGDTVEGFKVASEGGADAMVAALQAAYFFDPTEFDKKLRAKKRGSAPVRALTYEDIVERDGSAMDIERVQEVELLRKVNVTTIDSSIDYTTNKQTAERRSGTVKAAGESSIEIPITASPDFAASVALKRLKASWGEPLNFKYTLPIPHSDLTPADVVTFTDKHGRTYRMRIGMTEEEQGRIPIEASEDAPWAYDAKAVGVVAKPPTSTVPGLVGDTVVAVLSIPVQSDQDDELGYYVGAVGTGSGWYGAEVQVSTDGGASVALRVQLATPATIGTTLTGLLPERDSEYLSGQTLRVRVPDPLESIDYEALLRYGNRAALRREDGTWEVMQFQAATQIDDDTFDLSGLVRGRYATDPKAVQAGAQFVLLDEALLFVQLQQWMLGQTVSYRGVSYSQDSDEVEWSSFAATDVQSQTEWPVDAVKATRDSAQAVTVTWVGRARLGVETAPRQSKYFVGYRIVYSDGFAVDTTSTSHTRGAVPTGVSVQVAALNSITGPGPFSEAIPT